MSDTETQSLQSSRPQAAAKSEDMSQNISKKRSDEDISKDENKQPQSSVTLRGDVETANDLPTFNAANAQPELDSDIDQMPPPPRPASGEIKSSQRQAQSGQRLQDAQQSQTGSTQMMSSLNIESQTDKATADADPMDDASHSDDMDSSSSCHTADPHAELEAFDWIDLQQRYHDKVLELQTKEDSILQDFGLLCNYFEVWAQAGSRREVDRSFKRMKTQITLVQHHEDLLEQKRQHYIQVVNAFKSALDLLAK